MSSSSSQEKDTSTSDSSLQLQLTETQTQSSLLSPKHLGSPFKENEGPKWSDKLKERSKDKLKLVSSSSTSSPLTSRPSLDESVIIEDSPVNVGTPSRDISIINISDSSFHLVLDETPKGSTNVSASEATSPQSEVLAPNTLLYEDCDNIDNVIDNDEDVQSMKEAMEVVSDFITSGGQEPQSWSPKQNKWSATNERKRKPDVACLSSNESPKKKIHSKPVDDDQKDHHVTSEDSQDQVLAKSTDMDLDSRPSSSASVPPPDISCSPIPIVSGVEQIRGPEGADIGARKNSASTPVEKNKIKSLSSPQKIMREKLAEEHRNRNHSSSDEEEQTKASRIPTSNHKPKNDSQTFKEPANQSNSLVFTVADMKSLELPHVKDAIEVLKSEGITLCTDGVVTNGVTFKKRLSDGSNISSGGSSGYLGCSSGSGSSQRSRLSIAPEAVVDRHNVISKLPDRNNFTTLQNSDNKDATKSTSKTNDTVNSSATSLQKSDSQVSSIATVAKNSANNTPVTEQKRRGRKKKDTGATDDKVDKKSFSGKEEMSDASVEQKPDCDQSEKYDTNDEYGVKSKVFARWGDRTGVHFYPAVINKVVNEETVTVKFLADNIVKNLKKTTEIVTPGQMRSGHSVTVKHDVYSVYDVTARLLKYPTKKDRDYEYEVQITATDSEPQVNEDSRTVSHNNITLTGGQAAEILRDKGIAISNKVSSKVDLSNLLYFERKRGSTTPSTSGSTTTTSITSPASALTGSGRRRRRGGENCDESAATTHESSAAETSPRKTPRKSVQAVTAKYKRRLLQSTDEEEVSDVKNESVGSNSSQSKRESRGGKQIFTGMSFILTHSKEKMLPLTEPDAQYDSFSSEAESPVKNVVNNDPKFDKKSLRSVIEAHGGIILTEVSDENINTQEMVMMGVSDKECRTMNYLLCLAHSVPLVSHIYILDCVRSSKLLDRAAYLLPAGFSVLLMRNVEQGQDNSCDLNVNGCLMPYPPATSTRLSSRVKNDDAAAGTSRTKVLSGLHVLLLSTDKQFNRDWQSVLDSLGCSVTCRHSQSSRLSQIRCPDVVVSDSTAPVSMCKDLRNADIPVVSSNWIIQCTINNARIAYANFKFELPS